VCYRHIRHTAAVTRNQVYLPRHTKTNHDPHGLFRVRTPSWGSDPKQSMERLGSGGGTLKVDGMTEPPTEQQFANTCETADETAINETG